MIDIGTRIKDIELADIPNLESLSLNSYCCSNIRKLHIYQNVGVKAMSLQSTIELIWSQQKSNRKLESIHIENVNWTDFPVEALEWYCDVPTCEFKGRISVKEGSLGSGSKMTWPVKNKVNAKLGNVDGGGDLKITYAQKDFDAANATIKGNFFADNEKEYAGNETFSFAVQPGDIYENTQVGIRYELQCNKSGHYTMNEQTGLLSVDMTHPNLDTETTAVVRAVVTVAGGAEHAVEKEVNFWKRPAKVGDVVYYDGSYADADTDNGEKTVVAMCCYVAPRKADGSIDERYHNPLDKMTRLCVSRDDVSAASATENFTSWQWGPYPINGTESEQNAYSLFYFDAETGTRKNLTMDGTSIYDVPNLTNLASGGLYNPDGTSTSYITDDSFRDKTGEHLNNAGFKPISADYALGDGFAYNESAGFATARTLDDVLAPLAGSGYAQGEMVNSGYAKTLRVIAHRNNIIRYLQQNGNINGLEIEMQRPAVSGGKSELSVLVQCMSDLRAWAKSEDGLNDPNGNKWSQLYFPAPSACYAFQPTGLKSGEVLAAKFEAHNWFLPPEGLLGRLWYYTYDYTDTNADGTKELIDRADSPFAKAIRKGLFRKFTASVHWSVTEGSSYDSWYVGFNVGYTNDVSKYNSLVGRAVSAF